MGSGMPAFMDWWSFIGTSWISSRTVLRGSMAWFAIAWCWPGRKCTNRKCLDCLICRIIILDLGVHICTHVCTYKYAYTISMYIYHKNISPEPGGSFHHIYIIHMLLYLIYIGLEVSKDMQHIHTTYMTYVWWSLRVEVSKIMYIVFKYTHICISDRPFRAKGGSFQRDRQRERDTGKYVYIKLMLIWCISKSFCRARGWSFQRA